VQAAPLAKKHQVASGTDLMLIQARRLPEWLLSEQADERVVTQIGTAAGGNAEQSEAVHRIREALDRGQEVDPLQGR